MFKPTLKKLRSFVATCLLVMAPVGFAGTAEPNNEITPSFVDVRSKTWANSRNESRGQEDDLPSFYWQQTFNAVTKQRDEQGLSLNLDLHIALTKVEEAYQDEFDRLLDWQEEQIQQFQGNRVAIAKLNVQIAEQAATLKRVRRAKLEQINRLYL